MAGLEGRTLDRYQLQQLIGRGGMADVYMAYDTHFERQVAVKVFKREDEDLLRRFVREAHLMASLRNPHLIPVYDSGTSQLDGTNFYYIVMPLMEGGTLRSLTKRGPISLQTACRYMRDIADALDYIHRQGIIHRDIKASNVLLDEDGRCYLSDFGIARAMTDSSQMTGTGNVLGTVDYMAPELFEVHQRAAPSSDLYALGVLLFEMVTGGVPFSGENQIAVVTMHVSKAPPVPSSIVPSIPPMVDQVILRSLEKQPALRYGSASELAEAFCQATTMPQVQGARVTNPMWGTAQTRVVGVSDPILGETRREPQPVLLPPGQGQRSTEFPRATGQFAVGSYMPSNVDQYGVQSYNAQASAYPNTLASPERKQARLVIVLALVALLVILAPVGYLLYTHANPTNTPGGGSTIAPVTTQTTSVATPTPNLTATGQAVASAGGTATAQAQNSTTATAVAGGTATAQAQATATQQGQSATATAVAAPTITAQANATATITAAQSATSGQAIYTDALNSPTSATAAKWDQSSNCVFQSDGYHVLTSLLTTQLSGCHEANNSYRNFALTVNIAIKKGLTGGVFFRMQANSLALGAYSGYLFEIDNAGRYRIAQSDSFNSGQTEIQDWTASSALKTGAAQNKLQIVARDSSLVFFINGAFVAAPPADTTYLRSGNIGFLATVANDGSGQTADVVYSNINVYP